VLKRDVKLQLTNLEKRPWKDIVVVVVVVIVVAIILM